MRRTVGLIVLSGLTLGTCVILTGQSQTATGTLERINVHGRSLEKNLEALSPDRPVLIYLPAAYASNRDRRYPVLYLLHGASLTGHAVWTGTLADVKTIADRVMAVSPDRGMIVVIPDASTRYLGASYSNSIVDGNWEDFISRDLVDYVDAHYRTVAHRSSRGIAGHSRGGYGALRLAMRRSDVFGAVYAMSPCCADAVLDAAAVDAAGDIHTLADVDGLRQRQQLARNGDMWTALANAAAWSPNRGRPPLYFDLPRDQGRDRPNIIARWRANSLLDLADTHRRSLRALNGVAFDVGTQDRAVSLAGIVQLDAHLTRTNIPHYFEQYDGTHVNRVAERMETKLLPFFMTRLSRSLEPFAH